MQKNETGLFFIPYTKINSNLNVRPETIKLLEENIDNMFFAVGLSNIFLDLSLQARETKTKINKLHQTKQLCTVKPSTKQKGTY